MTDAIWEVFARKAREDPLRHIGSLHAPDAALAGVYAWKIYDEERWFEMVVAPREEFAAVNREEAPFTLLPGGAPEPEGDGSPRAGPARRDRSR